jgi:hypothetical protein
MLENLCVYCRRWSTDRLALRRPPRPLATRYRHRRCPRPRCRARAGRRPGNASSSLPCSSAAAWRRRRRRRACRGRARIDCAGGWPARRSCGPGIRRWRCTRGDWRIRSRPIPRPPPSRAPPSRRRGVRDAPVSRRRRVPVANRTRNRRLCGAPVSRARRFDSASAVLQRRFADARAGKPRYGLNVRNICRVARHPDKLMTRPGSML